MRDAGFTLIEILIVIAIIGILAAVLTYSDMAAIRHTNDAAAQNQGRVVNLAVEQWLSLSPIRSASSLSGHDCAQATTLTDSGPSSGYSSGDVGWPAATTSMICRITPNGQHVNVTTKASNGNKTFTNGEAQ